jgi:hypothetical protein
MKHKVEIRDSVNDHMKREANWRSRIRMTWAFIFFGGVLFIFGSEDSIIGFPDYLMAGGVLVIFITLLTFAIALSERRRFNETYEYVK